MEAQDEQQVVAYFVKGVDKLATLRSSTQPDAERSLG